MNESTGLLKFLVYNAGTSLNWPPTLMKGSVPTKGALGGPGGKFSGTWSRFDESISPVIYRQKVLA
jgi:hypothetical protein